MALVSWLSHAFPDSLFINALCAHIMFERSTEGEFHNPTGTSSDGRTGSLEQVAWVLATQRQKDFPLKINN